ncbi:MAG: SRPBCC family protein [Dehalococcoidia bacterium]
MADNTYQFITHWRVDSTREEVYDLLRDAESLTRWWPSVYLSVRRVQTGDEGEAYDLHTKGWLPYTLTWRLRVDQIDRPRSFSLIAEGDFVGRGIWTFVQDGPAVDITYDWKIAAEKPLLRLFTPLLRPLFEANHRWAMERGLESLHLELARRRATTDLERLAVPAPPAAISSAAPLVAGGVLLAMGVVAWLALRGHRAPAPGNDD